MTVPSLPFRWASPHAQRLAGERWEAVVGWTLGMYGTLYVTFWRRPSHPEIGYAVTVGYIVWLATLTSFADVGWQAERYVELVGRWAGCGACRWLATEAARVA